MSGCSRVTRHKVLTFFFTGVPPLEEKKKPQETEDKKIDPIDTQAEKYKPPKLYNHPLYASGACGKCHKVSLTFRVLGHKNIATTVFRKGGGSPGELILVRQQLCVGCHLGKSPAQAKAASIWLHTPAARGSCQACHDAHQSTYPKILLHAAEDICSGCHHQSPVMQRADHLDSGKCLGCHNPHMGINSQMLKTQLSEVHHVMDTLQVSAEGEAGPEGNHSTGAPETGVDHRP